MMELDHPAGADPASDGLIRNMKNEMLHFLESAIIRVVEARKGEE